jgi:hypothetical protein
LEALQRRFLALPQVQPVAGSARASVPFVRTPPRLLQGRPRRHDLTRFGRIGLKLGRNFCDFKLGRNFCDFFCFEAFRFQAR